MPFFSTFIINNEILSENKITFVLIFALLLLIIAISLFLTKRARYNNLVKIRCLVNEINKYDTTKDISQRVLKASIDFFGFDYALVSIINHLNSSISTLYTSTANKNLVDPKSWKDESSYPLNGEDILCEVARNQKVEIRIGRKVDINKDKSLNKFIFEKFDHKNLNRFFIPISHSFDLRFNKNKEGLNCKSSA